jgi:hypothetical protein
LQNNHLVLCTAFCFVAAKQKMCVQQKILAAKENLKVSIHKFRKFQNGSVWVFLEKKGFQNGSKPRQNVLLFVRRGFFTAIE